ncbi:MAG: thermonuclease family protein [Kineosporiaceae bacterium]
MRDPSRRSRGRIRRPPVGILLALGGFVLLAVVAVQWAGLEAREEAVEGALEDIPGPDADTVTVSGVAPAPDAQEVRVVRVVDGDTLVVAGDGGPVVDGGEVRVRLLLLDTPEVDGPDATEECLGPEASDFAAELMPEGSTLRLALDEASQDEFGRTLAYAWTEDGTFVNEAIVRNGYGYAALVAPNDEHVSVMLAAEDAAREERRGVWGAC